MSKPKSGILFDPKADRKKVILKPKSIPKNTIIDELKAKYQTICSEEQRLDNAGIEFESRRKLVELYDFILKTDVKLALKYDIEGRKWKYLVYNIFSKYRSTFKSIAKVELQEWKSHFEAALDFYHQLVGYLKSKNKKPVWAKSVLHMADICRYIANHFTDDQEKQDYLDQALKYYAEFSQLMPGNGFVWNQIGLVYHAKKLYLSSIMNQLHALCVPNPFKSAKESLLDTFHQVLDSQQIRSTILPDVQDESVLDTETTFLTLQQIIFTKIK